MSSINVRRSSNIPSFTPYTISDSIWLTHGSLLIAAGQQMYLFSEPLDEGEGKISESLMEFVARQNGPLDDYHPQMLLQCLIWGKFLTESMPLIENEYPGKFELVKEIIMNLCRVLHSSKTDLVPGIPHLPIGRFLEKEQRKTVSCLIFLCLFMSYHITACQQHTI